MESRVKYRMSFGGSLTPVVKILIIINVVAFVLLSLAKNNYNLLLLLGLVPKIVWHERYAWQLFTYLFIHVDFLHILFNMLALWWFGCDIERNFGKKYFLWYYFFTGVGAGLFAIALSPASTIPVIGASGAIFGILLAYAILYPNRVIYLWFIIPVKAKWVVLVFALLEVFAILRPHGTNISHSAHVGGIIFGLLWFGYYLGIIRLRWLKSLFSRKRHKPRIRVVPTDKNNVVEIYKDDDNQTVH